MNIDQFLHEYIIPFQDVYYCFCEDMGWIVWRLGTGSNIELLHIRTFEKGQGYGRILFYRMLDKLERNPPYHSVFGFTRVSNIEAQKFYGALGFHLQQIQGLYKEGTAIFFYQEFEQLFKKRNYEHTLCLHKMDR